MTNQTIVEPKLLSKAVNALLKHHESKAASNNSNQLLGTDLSIHVQFNLTRIPEQTSLSARPIRIEIPHSLTKLNGDNTNGDNEKLEEAEVCLIVKDSSKEWIKDLISQFPKELSYIKKVLTLTSLRKKYAQYQDKRTLCNSYSLFIVDDRILPMVGKLIGKSFFMKKKQPVPVKLTRKEALPFAIEKCIKSAYLLIGAGTCLSVKTASTAMSSKPIEDNIQSVIKNAIPHIPRKATNISSISIKTDTSIALPVYNKVREELEAVEKLANLESNSSNNTNKDTDANSKSKKRTLEDKEEGETSKEEKEKADKKKKQKKEDLMKSPLLKALKKKKQKEAEEEAELEEEKVVEESKQKKKKKKRTSSDTDAAGEDSNNSNVKKSAKKAKETESKEKKSESDETGKSDEKKKLDFIPSKKFKGGKAGYVFKLDKKGLGYYIDVKPVPSKSLSGMTSIRAGSITGSGFKARSKGRKGGRKGRRLSY